MADVKSHMTKKEEMMLLRLLGSKHITLLYKGSVHGFNVNTFHYICNRQGPTVAVAYNASGYIFGGFTVQSYSSSGAYLNDDKAFLFRLKGKENESSPVKIPVKNAQEAVYDNGEYGPYFGAGSLILLSENKAAVATNPNVASYAFQAEDLHGNDQVLIECEVYRVEGKLKRKENMSLFKPASLYYHNILCVFFHRCWRYYGDSLEEDWMDSWVGFTAFLWAR